MSKQLPNNPSLEHLKNEAKALLRSASDPEIVRLADAQRVLAREYGFASWAKLKRHVEGYSDARAAFFDAIRAGDRERVSALLEDSHSLIHAHDPDSFGAPAITPAVNRGDKPMIDLLLEHGADIDARSDWWAGSFGALDYADEETAMYLLKRGATLTPHAAARLGMVEELRRMIAADPSVVNQRGGDGQMPLHFAKNVEIVDLLLDYGADIEARDIDHEGTPAQHHVMHPEILRRLVDRGAATDVFMAVALDDEAMLERWLDDDPEAATRMTSEPGNPMIPEAPGRHIYTYSLGFVTPLLAAADFASERCYAVLFARSSPTQQLVAACWKGDRETALRLRNEAQYLRKREQRMMHFAAKRGRIEATLLMAEAGFDLNVQDDEGFSPIGWAALHGADAIVEGLLPYNPDLQITNVYGGTVLTGCIWGSMHRQFPDSNHARCVELLLGAGAKPPDRLFGSLEVRQVLARFGIT